MYQFHDKFRNRVEDKRVLYPPKWIYSLVEKSEIHK